MSKDEDIMLVGWGWGNTIQVDGIQIPTKFLAIYKNRVIAHAELKKINTDLKEDFACITKQYMDDKVKLEAKIKRLEIKINRLKARLMISHDTLGPSKLHISLLKKRVETLERGYQARGTEGWSCPGCKYEDGVFIEHCQLHKRLDEAWEIIERLDI